MRRLALPLSLLVACGGSPGNKAPAAPSNAPRAAAREVELSEPLWLRDVGFKTPECALYDPRADVYLVSNIDGSPLDEDDRAFISRVRPDGSVEALKWIDAEQAGVTMHAPKGMALAGQVLYVADIRWIRKFDRDTGRALGSIDLPSATFINDLSADPQGNLYATDSGLAQGFKPSGSDAVYKLTSEGQLGTVLKDPSLGRPNGISSAPGGLWVVTFGSGELYRLSASGARSDAVKLPKGSLDGVAQLDERLFISSWEASAVYERTGDTFTELVSNLPAPSDIGIDPRRKRLLIPLFYDDTLILHPL